MASSEGWVDYGSGRYKLVGCPGQEDYYFHAGEWLEVWRETRWLAVQVLADLSGRWYFVDGNGSSVAVALGMRGRRVNEWLAMWLSRCGSLSLTSSKTRKREGPTGGVVARRGEA